MSRVYIVQVSHEYPGYNKSVVGVFCSRQLAERCVSGIENSLGRDGASGWYFLITEHEVIYDSQ